MYVDCRFGQLHLHTAFPSSGGFDELTSLLCIHPSPLSGGVFRGLLSDMGRDRSVYAPDLPGHGESDAPDSPPSILDYAMAVGDLLDSLRLRKVDVIGYQTGSLAAVELAIARPEQVRRVILAGVPVFDSKEREAFNARPSGSGSGAHAGRLRRWRAWPRTWSARCRRGTRPPGAQRRLHTTRPASGCPWPGSRSSCCARRTSSGT
jgi:pimeloyl-ACP methyl ester carboxylesterase